MGSKEGREATEGREEGRKTGRDKFGLKEGREVTGGREKGRKGGNGRKEGSKGERLGGTVWDRRKERR